MTSSFFEKFIKIPLCSSTIVYSLLQYVDYSRHEGRKEQLALLTTNWNTNCSSNDSCLPYTVYNNRTWKSAYILTPLSHVQVYPFAKHAYVWKPLCPYFVKALIFCKLSLITRYQLKVVVIHVNSRFLADPPLVGYIHKFEAVTFDFVK